MWVLDLQAEINSDFSVFHGIRDPMSLDSPRYFQDVSLLHHYDGAVRAARVARAPLTAEAPAPVTVPQLGQPGQGGEQPVVLDDMRAVAALTQAPGFPGIEYIEG